MHFNHVLGGLIPVDSFFHQADPRIKLVYTLYGMIVIFFLKEWFAFLLLGLIVIIIIYISKVPFITVIKSFRSIYILIILTFIFQLFNKTGTVIISFSFFTITEESLQNAFLISSRLILVVGLSILMTATTSPIKIADSVESILQTLGCKKKFAHEIAMIMSLAIRFVPIISIEANQIIKAQKTRGAKFDDRNIYNKIKAFIPVMIPLLVNSFKRAEELALAMDVRYYNGFQGRTKYVELKLKHSDILLLILMVVFFTFTLYLDKVIAFG